MNRSDSGSYASEAGTQGALPARDDPAAWRRLGWLVGFALGFAVLSVAAVVAAGSVSNLSCKDIRTVGVGHGTTWVVFVWMAIAFAAGSCVTCVAGVVTASLQLKGTRWFGLWIAVFAVVAIVLPVLVIVLIGALMLLQGIQDVSCAT